MQFNKYISSFLFIILVTTLTACGGGGTNSNFDTNNADTTNADDNNSADNNDDSVDDSTGGSNASVSWTIGSKTYTSNAVVSTFENDDFAILSLNASEIFSSEISISYTLTGSGSYYISGSPASVAEDSEESQLNPKRIAILVQEKDASSSIGANLYQTLPGSGFVKVTVDSAGKYHFDIPSSSPISLGNLVLGETMNTIDFSMINIYDYR